MTKQNTNMPSTPKINQPPPYVTMPPGYHYYPSSPNYPSYPSSPQQFSNDDPVLSVPSLLNEFNNLNLQNVMPSNLKTNSHVVRDDHHDGINKFLNKNQANVMGFHGAAFTNTSNSMMPNYHKEPVVNYYPNEPMIPSYLKSIPPLKLPEMSVQISPNSITPISPHRSGFYGAQSANNMIPNRSLMSPYPGNMVPNYQHGIMSSQLKIAQPYHPFNATIQQFANENDLACIEVWSQDQGRMVSRVKQLAKTFKVIAFDTEFPGDPLGPNDNWRDATADETYGYIKNNVDCSKMISLG